MMGSDPLNLGSGNADDKCKTSEDHAEVYVKKVMNRDEFRALCDRYKTASAILKALQGG